PGPGREHLGAGRGPAWPAELEETEDEEKEWPDAVQPVEPLEDALAGSDRPSLELGVDEELGDDADPERPVEPPAPLGDYRRPEHRLARTERRAEHDGARSDDVRDLRYLREVGNAEPATTVRLRVLAGRRRLLQRIVVDGRIDRLA